MRYKTMKYVIWNGEIYEVIKIPYPLYTILGDEYENDNEDSFLIQTIDGKIKRLKGYSAIVCDGNMKVRAVNKEIICGKLIPTHKDNEHKAQIKYRITSDTTQNVINFFADCEQIHYSDIVCVTERNGHIMNDINIEE